MIQKSWWLEWDYTQTECECPKPKSGLLIREANDFSIDVAFSYHVGDKWSYVQAGRAVACRTVLVRTSHGTLELQSETRPVDYIADDFYDAVISNIFCHLFTQSGTGNNAIACL